MKTLCGSGSHALDCGSTGGSFEALSLPWPLPFDDLLREEWAKNSSDPGCLPDPLTQALRCYTPVGTEGPESSHFQKSSALVANHVHFGASWRIRLFGHSSPS